jgi:catechol 2,3-dioxygenase-like lactoylglutathione lyase family enzyme
LMLVYALPEGGSLVFSAARESGSSPATDDVSWERRHVGLAVRTRAEFDHWLERLKDARVNYQLIDDERIYFADRDGLVLELEVASEVPDNPAALEILARWQPD